MYIVIERKSQKKKEKEVKKSMKYVVKFELRDEAMGTQNEEDFIPEMICRMSEIYEMFEMYTNDPDGCESYIVDIRHATKEDEDRYPHYYC